MPRSSRSSGFSSSSSSFNSSFNSFNSKNGYSKPYATVSSGIYQKGNISNTANKQINTPHSSQSANTSTSYANPSFMDIVKEGFAFGVGSSVARNAVDAVFGGQKIVVEHTNTQNIHNAHNTHNASSSNQSYCNTDKDNCAQILLNYNKCKEDYNCKPEIYESLRNEYENCLFKTK